MLNVRCFGHFRFHLIMAVIYFAVALGVPLKFFTSYGKDAPEQLLGREWFVWWLMVTVLGLPLFIWLERLKFEKWMTDCPQLPSKPHRDQFELNAKHMEVFWKAVATMYLTAGLFSFQLKPVPKSEPEAKKVSNAPTQAELQQLTQAVTLLANAVSKNPGVIPVTNPGIQKSDAGEQPKAAAVEKP